MTIPTRMSLHGFIATVPELHLATSGESRFYATVGVEHYRHEADGSFTQLDSTFHNLVAYEQDGRAAHRRQRQRP